MKKERDYRFSWVQQDGTQVTRRVRVAEHTLHNCLQEKLSQIAHTLVDLSLQDKIPDKRRAVQVRVEPVDADSLLLVNVRLDDWDIVDEPAEDEPEEYDEQVYAINWRWPLELPKQTQHTFKVRTDYQTRAQALEDIKRQARKFATEAMPDDVLPEGTLSRDHLPIKVTAIDGLPFGLKEIRTQVPIQALSDAEYKEKLWKIKDSLSSNALKQYVDIHCGEQLYKNPDRIAAMLYAYKLAWRLRILDKQAIEMQIPPFNEESA